MESPEKPDMEEYWEDMTPPDDEAKKKGENRVATKVADGEKPTDRDEKVDSDSDSSGSSDTDLNDKGVVVIIFDRPKKTYHSLDYSGDLKVSSSEVQRFQEVFVVLSEIHR